MLVARTSFWLLELLRFIFLLRLCSILIFDVRVVDMGIFRLLMSLFYNLVLKFASYLIAPTDYDFARVECFIYY